VTVHHETESLSLLSTQFIVVVYSHLPEIKPSLTMEKEQRVFLAYRAVFEGNNAQIRQPKAIKKLVSQHRTSAQTLLQSLGENQVIDTLKTLLERKVFQSELEAKLRFPKLFTISSSQSVQHIASEADAARSEAEALDDLTSLHGNDDDDAQDEIKAEAPTSLITPGRLISMPQQIYAREPHRYSNAQNRQCHPSTILVSYLYPL